MEHDDNAALAESWRYDPHERRMMLEALGASAGEERPNTVPDPYFEQLRQRREQIAASVRTMVDVPV